MPIKPVDIEYISGPFLPEACCNFCHEPLNSTANVQQVAQSIIANMPPNAIVFHPDGIDIHPIHARCIEFWLRKNSSCPTCLLKIGTFCHLPAANFQKVANELLPNLVIQAEQGDWHSVRELIGNLTHDYSEFCLDANTEKTLIQLAINSQQWDIVITVLPPNRVILLPLDIRKKMLDDTIENGAWKYTKLLISNGIQEYPYTNEQLQNIFKRVCNSLLEDNTCDANNQAFDLIGSLLAEGFRVDDDQFNTLLKKATELHRSDIMNLLSEFRKKS